MKRSLKNLFILTVTAAITLSSTAPADACGGARSGSRLGSFRGRGLLTGVPSILTRSRQNARQTQVARHQIRPTAPLQIRTGQPFLVPQITSAPQPVYRSVPVAPAVTIQAAPAQPSAVTNAPSDSSRTDDGKPSAEASALQILASIGEPASAAQTPSRPTKKTATAPTMIPEFSAPTAATSQPHLGTWTVDLPGEQSVELVLSGDGGFRWTATRQEKTSTFAGQYRLDGKELTLVRSTDLQQMRGTWENVGSGFTFTMSGSTTGGLAFRRK